jgi:hypothetical protein
MPRQEKSGNPALQESAGQLDSHLFVGDMAGLKRARAEAKKIESSRSGKHYLYLSGIKEAAKLSVANDDNDDPGWQVAVLMLPGLSVRIER